MSNVVLITGCSIGIGRHLAAVPLSGRLEIRLRDFVWSSVLKQMFKINSSEMQP
jgi:short-subunit dehydrogenase involved in D-alanine esterification of teichoic acids